MKKRLVVLLVVGFSVFLTGCLGQSLPWWKIADQGEPCNKGVVVEKHWNGMGQYEHYESFRLLVETRDGEIGIVPVSPYQYKGLEVNDPVCVVP